MTPRIFPSKTETAKAVIEYILNLTELSGHEPLNIALSGGSTPALMFDLWASEYAGLTPWDRLKWFWVDERCVPPRHPDSNYGMTMTHLLSKVPVDSSRIFRIKGEDNPETEARRYSDLVGEQLGREDGFPAFDIVLLGAGDDGHTSSVFPGQEHLLTTASPYAVSVHPTSGQRRVALTGQPIIRAAHCLFLMTGSSKAPVLRGLRASADSGPAAYVAHHARHDLQIFADTEAARLAND